MPAGGRRPPFFLLNRDKNVAPKKNKMCGLTAWVKRNNSEYPLSNLSSAAGTVQHRGPDRTKTELLDGPHGLEARIDFHRLCINGLDGGGDQPFHVGDWYCVVNGEIYNHRQLEDCYPAASTSDCEVVAQMLSQGRSANEVARSLDGVFAMFAINMKEQKAVVARDIFGVRALYWGSGPNLAFCVASEMKALHAAGCDVINVFPPSTCMEVYFGDGGLTFSSTQYWPSFTLRNFQPLICEENRAIRTCQTLLRAAVKKRIMADRLPIGCFLSGGLDSSLIAALLVEQLDSPTDLHTFSIGMSGSADLKYAQTVATFLGTTHHQVVVSEEEMLAAIPDALRHMETFDVTTIRAGTGMFLLSQWISKHSSVRVIFSGEGSDELSGSYLYFRNAPSATAYQEECLRLCADLHRYDNLRADKATSAHGLEVRTPFLDREFANIYLRIDPALRRPRQIDGRQIEKYLLRISFQHSLPKSVVWRTKEAFSDGVSSNQKSWFEIIQDHVGTLALAPVQSRRLPPAFPEAQWYRNLYEKAYSAKHDHLIPYYWLPKWQGGDVVDPSARVLDTYKN